MDTQGSQIEVSWEEAAAVIGVHARAAAGECVVVGITGPVGAGKTTLARRVSACIIATDSYLPDYDLVEAHRRDDPDAADLDLLARHLSALRRGRAALVPVWSFQTHRRETYRSVEPARVVVVEGIHALCPAVLPHVDLRVYVDAAAQRRWRRWEEIESAGERGMGVEAARRHFDEIAEPAFARFGAACRGAAHIVVLNDGHSVPG